MNGGRAIAVVFGAAALLAQAAEPPKLSMRDAVEAAGKLNPDIQIARLRSLESEAAVGVASSAYKPQVSAGISGAYQTNNLAGQGLVFPALAGFPARVGPYRVFNARPMVTQTILDLGLVSQIRAARQRFEGSKRDAEAVRETTQLAVLEIYLQALQAESRIHAAGARVATAKAILDQASDQQQAGTASQLDVARAEYQYRTEQTTTVSARRDYQDLKALLLRTIGNTGDASVELAPEALQAEAQKLKLPLDPVEDTARAAFVARPEVQALEARSRAALYDVEAARRQRWPRLSGEGDFGALGAGPDRSVSTFNVGASLTVPIFTGRRIESQIQSAEASALEAGQEVRKAKLEITQQVRQAAIEMRAARETLESAGKATVAARTSVELARLRFGAGLSTSIDTVTAQGTLAQAEDLEIRTRFDYFVAKARWARARGDVMLFFSDL